MCFFFLSGLVLIFLIKFRNEKEKIDKSNSFWWRLKKTFKLCSAAYHTFFIFNDEICREFLCFDDFLLFGRFQCGQSSIGKVWVCFFLRRHFPHLNLNEKNNNTDERTFSFLVAMDKICNGNPIALNGDNRTGIFIQLTGNSKYAPNMDCSVTFRTSLATQRLIVTVEKMNVADCPADTLKIYDGTNLLTKDSKQQCGTTNHYTFTVSFSIQ